MPLSVGHREVALGYRAEQNTNGSLSSTGHGEYGNRYSFSYVDQFADNRFGVALGYAHLDSPGQAKKYGAWAFGDYNGQWGSSATGVPLVDAAAETAFSAVMRGVPAGLRVQRHLQQAGAGRPDGRPGVPAERALLQRRRSLLLESSSRTAWGTTGWATSACGAPPRPTSATSVPLSQRQYHHQQCHGGRWSQLRVRQELGPYRQDHLDRLAKRARFRQRVEGALDLGYSYAARSEDYIQSVARANANSSFDFANPGTAGASSTSWTTPQDLTDPASCS
jgi:hypothetical protein